MQNMAKSQPKQTQGQKKSKGQSRKKQPLKNRPPAALATPASDEKYRRLFETAQDGILLVDATNGVISDANPAVEEMLGYSPAELVGNKLWETGPFKDVSASQTAFLNLQKKNYFRYEDLPLETRDGQRRNVDFVSNVYQVGNQKVIQCNIRDITERRQAENALAESMRRYQELFDNAALGIFQTGADGRIMAVNPEFARMFGYQSPEELLSLVGDAAAVFADPQRRAEIIRIKASNPGVTRFENLYRRKDGSTFFGSLTLRQATGPDGRMVFEGLVEDITERKQAQELLHEDEARYRDIFEGVQDAIFVESPSGKILDINERACEMFGYSREQFLTKTVADLVPSEKSIVPFNLNDASPVPYHPVETVNVRANREQFPIEISIRLQKQKGETVLFVVGRDITGRKQAEAALRLRMEQLVALNQASLAVTTSLDIDQVLTEVMSLAGKVVGSEYTSVVLFEEAGHISRSVENVPGVLGLQQRARKSGFTKWILRTRRAAVVDEIGEDGVVSPRVGAGAPRTANPHLVAQGIKSFVGLPLIVESRTVGVLYLHSLHTGTFHEQLPLLTNFSNQAAVAIEKAHLYAAVRKELNERRSAEEKLKEKEEMFRSFIEQSSEGAILLDEQGSIIEWNYAQENITGIERQHAIGEPFWAIQYQLLPPERRSKTGPDFFKKAMLSAFRTGEFPTASKLVEATIYTTHGETKSILQASFPIRTEKGYRIGSLVRDITERKRSEDALRESENLLRESQVSAGLGSYVLDLPGGLWKSSDMLDKVFGIDETFQRTVDSWAALTHPEDRKMMVDYFNKEVLGQGRLFNKEYRIIRYDNHVERWVHGLGRLEFDAEGQAVKMHGTIQDITERKQAQEALADERNLLRALIDNIPDFVYVKDTQGRNILANRSCAQRTGLTEPEQMLGTTDYDFFPRELADRYTADDQKVIQSGQPLLGHEEPTLDGAGTPKWISTNKVPLRDGQGKIYGLVGVGRDITERKQSEEKLASQAEELRRRNDELARLYRASGSLISGASLSHQELAQKIVEVVQQEFGQANCSLLTVSRESNELLRLAAAGPYTGQVKNKRLSLDGPGLVPQAIRTGATINVGDVRSVPEYVSNWESARSELAIPLKIGNQVVGVIDVQSSEQQGFSPDDERLMSIFAERAALALEHSRLNTQTEKHLQQLLALRTIDMAISSSFDISMTLGVLLDQITRLLGVHAVDILAFNTPTQTFKFAGERGFRNHSLHHIQIKFGAGYAWNLVRERQMIVVPDIRAEADGLQRTPDLSAEQFITYIGIPVLAKGQVKGVLEIFQREPLVLEPEGFAFLEMLAGQAAIAIDNSELFERLQSSNAELGMAYDSTLEGWANALELRDKETEGHTRRVAELSTRLAQTMGVRENDILQVYRGALLHDIGKMGVPDSIVLKPGPLTDEEWVIMRKHPQYASDMLSPIAYLRQALDIPYCHHEKWDGTGYPRGLKGPQIPMPARIFAVVDVWDAITSDRPYRKAWQKEVAVQYIQEQSGRHFDPEVVKAFLSASFKRE